MKIIREWDVRSLYPSIMLQYNMLSRNMSNTDDYKKAYDDRIHAKKTGDIKTSNSLKLALNTTYGASLNQYNDLYDPLMGRSVCITGQLLMTQLVVEVMKNTTTCKVLQINTDAYMLELDDSELEKVRNFNSNWEKLTGLVLEEIAIKKIVQRDVNNYVMLTVNNEVIVKGGIVSDYKGGNFKHNSLAIVCKAVVDYLLFDKSIEDTINNCNDPFMFQMVVKTGRTFDRVLHEVNGQMVEVNRVNRLYATLDESFGMVYKMKGESKNKVPNCPEHTIVDNLGKISIDSIDKSWYIKLTHERVDKFLGITRRKKKMATETVEKKETKKRTSTKKVPSFKEKMFQLGLDITEESKKFIKDGYNDAQSYEYVKASQYKAMFRDCIAKNRLMYKIDDVMCQVQPDALKSAKMTLTQYHASLTIMDVDSDERESFMLWSQGADNLDKGLSKAKTLALKDFVKLNFGISDNEDDPEASEEPKKPTKKFTTPASKKEAKATVMANKPKATQKQIDDIKSIIAKIREASNAPTFAEKTLAQLESGITASDAVVKLTKLELKANEYGLEV